MLSRTAFIVVVGLGAGCGSKPTVAAPAAARCDAVADHLVSLAQQDNQAAPSPHLATGMRAEFIRQCEADPWSTARRDCLLAAADQEATLACPTR